VRMTMPDETMACTLGYFLASPLGFRNGRATFQTYCITVSSLAHNDAVLVQRFLRGCC